MTIDPDTKDWTWVLREPCPDCGLDAGATDPRTVGARIEEMLPRWQDVLARPDAATRPGSTIWSPSEYACHVRDVFDLFADRVRQMLDQDDPMFANWDQDETAVAHDYAAQDPAVVSDQLVAAGRRAAAGFDAVPDESWRRPGRRNNGSQFTIETLTQYFLHDVVHHLHDVRG